MFGLCGSCGLYRLSRLAWMRAQTRDEKYEALRGQNRLPWHTLETGVRAVAGCSGYDLRRRIVVVEVREDFT
jgi:hypothetical protein